MAKRKRKKVVEDKKFKYTSELVGILLVLAAILGFGKYGPVGEMISSFAVFLVGTGYAFFLVLIFLIGGYMLIKREKPRFLTSKLVGLYILSIGLLAWAHDSYIIEGLDAMQVMNTTIDNLVASFSNISEYAIRETGGGIVGGGFAVLFYSLFDYQGMVIIRITFIIIGATLFTGFSIIDIVKNAINKGKDMLPTKGNEEETIKDKKRVIIRGTDDEEDDEPSTGEIKEDKKIVISSIDELTKVTDDHKQEHETEEKEPPKEPVKDNTNRNYQLPPMSLLNPTKKSSSGTDNATIEKNIVTLEKVLQDFGISGKVVEVHVGPNVTQYELEIKSGTKVSKILGINREIALVLAKKSVRIEAPIPGKNTVGIELPNDQVAMVGFREILEKVPKSKDSSKLLAALGKNIMGNIVWCEIDKTPHLLVAGTTGSGKSVCVNGIIASILMRAKPDEVKLVMVDPKKVELSGYNGIPHLMCPVVTDPKKAAVALAKIVGEMERRYEVFSDTRTKNISTYNEYIEKKNAKLPEEEQLKKMPYIVAIVDELADLMLVASKEVEDSILRITQMARAAGIHLIIATQRPSTDVITGLVKSNIPSRISFAVSSSIDSRTILDATGAEKLLGKGDMLLLPMGESSPQRLQGAYISDDEIKKIIDHTISQQIAQYDESMMNLNSVDNTKSASQVEDAGQKEEYDDPLYNEIVEFVIETQKASASLLQRRFKLGYNRAARIVDLLEERGIIGPQNGSKPREVLVQLDHSEEDE